MHDVDRGRRTPRAACAEHLGNVTRAEGFPTRAELIARYEELSGRSMGDIRWYTTLALWKSIVFMEGNYKRAIAGTTDDPYLKQFGEGVLELARQAEEVAHGACSSLTMDREADEDGTAAPRRSARRRPAGRRRERGC